MIDLRIFACLMGFAVALDLHTGGGSLGFFCTHVVIATLGSVKPLDD